VTALAPSFRGTDAPSTHGCSFCAALAGLRDEPAVVENEQFVAWISRGALVEGHLLVLPKRHVLSLRELEPAEVAPLLRFVTAVEEVLGQVYGSVALFEHGPAVPGSPVGCSTDHAHLHMVPWPRSLVELAEDELPGLTWRRVDGLSEALASESDSPYLFVRDADGTSSIASGPDIPSQAIRRAIATALGRREEWDWKAHPQPAIVRQTTKSLAPPPT
jgi:diadenosine tetraphosphate (Ap4A) HIT family hydrolase